MLAVRNGIPSFARKVLAGEETTIVAFGTSMTFGGHYLAHVSSALEAATGTGSVRLVNSGLRGFISYWAAFRVRDDVLPHRPDLVLIEFAHNDATDDALVDCVPGLEGIIAQIRSHNAACEIVFVYLAPRGVAAAGPSPAMRVHEEVAAYYGIPSIDLATLTEDVIASGEASWSGAGAPALTVDGVHHAELAAALLGIPFAEAIVELVRASTAPRPAEPPIRDRTLSGAWREPASRYIAEGKWGRGKLSDHETRIVEAYTENVAAAMEPGAKLRIPFRGRQAFVWALGLGTLTASFVDRAERFHVPVESGDRWRIRALMPIWEPGDYVLEATVAQTPVVLGDLFFVG
jgi:lysophospholipase L1-like esterase